MAKPRKISPIIIPIILLVNDLKTAENKLGPLLGKLLGICKLVGVVGVVLVLGLGLICLPITISRYKEVPGGSQVINVAVAICPGTGPKTPTSLGETSK